MSVNNTVRGLEEPSATSGIPGAYPSDNDLPSRSVAPDTTASQGYDLNDKSSHHNKLHKPNDPRGWDSDKTPRTHQYTDSGVGLGEKGSGYTTSDSYRASEPERDASRNFASHQGVTGVSDNYRTSEPERDVSRDFNSRQGVTGTSNNQFASEPQRQKETLSSATTTGNNNTYDKESTDLLAGAATRRDYSTREGTDSTMAPTTGLADENTRASEEHPYWGDLPRGAGVYNTVVGHGSREDDQPLHHDTQDSVLGSTAARSSRTTDDTANPSQKRAFPLTGGTYGGQDTQNDIKPAQNARDLNDIKDQKEETRHRDARNAALAASAASAAYPVASEHEKEKKQKHVEKEREAQKPKEEKESKLHALFHRDNSGKEEKPKKEHARKEKYDETVVAPVAARHTHEEQPRTGDLSRSTEPSQDYDNRQAVPEEKHSHFKEGLGLGAAGAGAGAAAYGASKYEQDKNKKNQPDYDWTSSPTSKQEPTYGSAQESQSLSHNAAPTSNQAAAFGTTQRSQNPEYSATSTSSQAPAYGSTQGSQNLGSRANAGHVESSSGDTQYNVLPSGTTSGVHTGGDDAVDSTSAPLSRAEQPASNDRSGISRSAGLVGAGAAAGAGAAYAQHSADKSRYEEPTAANSRYEQQPAAAYAQSQEQPTTREKYAEPSTRREKYDDLSSTTTTTTKPTRDVAADKVEQRTQPTRADELPRESRTHNTEALAAGATATGAGAALAYNARESEPKHAGVKGTSSTLGTSSAQHGGSSHHDDQYNHLASGTPSGINLEH